MKENVQSTNFYVFLRKYTGIYAALSRGTQRYQNINGHADLDMARHYLHVQEPIRQAALQKLNDTFSENSEKR